jgi:mono/diheme cytochrome c family protein
MSQGQARSILSYMRKVRAGVARPETEAAIERVSLVIGRYCASCHTIDGEGEASAPDLTRVGATRESRWLRQWITNPVEVDPLANMPAFRDTLTEGEMTSLVEYLAARK